MAVNGASKKLIRCCAKRLLAIKELTKMNVINL